MRKIAFGFPGQGAQYPGMGKEFYDNFEVSKKVFKRANKALGFDITEMCFNGTKEELSVTKFTQPAILTASVAMFEAVKSFGIEPYATGGLSLGEYTALTLAGCIEFEDAVRLVYERGTYMQDAVPLGEGGLLVLIGCTKEQAIDLCKYVTANCDVLEPANFNCPGQIAVGGKTEAIDMAIKISADYGVRRAIKLDVSAPFHTSMLEGAGMKLMKAMENVDFKMPCCKVVSNVDGEFYSDANQIADKLKRQVYNPVQWENCTKQFINAGADMFVEVGPGKSLSGFMKKIDKNIEFCNIENMETLNSFLGKVN